MSTYKSYETERLLLRPTTEEDTTFIFELINSPKWIQYIGDRKVYSLDAAAKYIQDRMLPQLERLGFGNYTVIRKSDGAKMGSCGIYDREGLEGVDIGFSFLEKYEKKGYAYESASKIMELAFSDFKLTQINAITTKNNLSSQKLIHKLGLKYLKKIRLPDDPEELLLYQLKRPEG